MRLRAWRAWEQTQDRDQSAAEEVANALSHGLGAAAAMLLLPWLVADALRAGMVEAVGAAVYGVSLILLFSVSALYHAWPQGPAKRLLQRLDHAAIFLLIAGSYTPFMVGVLADRGGHQMLGGVWAVAVAGSTLKCAGRLTHLLASTVAYLALGWAALLMVVPIFEIVPAKGLALIGVGGALYTLGAVVFHFDARVRYAHFLWHLLVVAGAGCHFLAVLLYAAS